MAATPVLQKRRAIHVQPRKPAIPALQAALATRASPLVWRRIAMFPAWSRNIAAATRAPLQNPAVLEKRVVPARQYQPAIRPRPGKDAVLAGLVNLVTLVP
jgi:hypothetical protein